MKSVFALLALTFTVSVSQAQSQKMYCDDIRQDDARIQTCKNIPLNRRQELGRKVAGGNPMAVALSEAGDVYVYYTVADSFKLQKCQVGGNARDLKVSNNPGDVATAYYIAETRNGDQLIDVRVAGEVSRGSCPKATKVNMHELSTGGWLELPIGGEVIEYALAPNSRAPYVGVALFTNYTVLWTDTTVRVEPRYMYEYRKLELLLQD